MATGFARGAKARGKRIAFGNKHQIIWDQNSETIFRNNPNIARPGCERDADIEWFDFWKGHRLYNYRSGDRWVWNLNFRAKPGEVFFDQQEARNGARYGRGFVLIEPHLPLWKGPYIRNKDWGFDKYQRIVNRLKMMGARVVQFKHLAGETMLDGVEKLKPYNFRDALAILSNASLYIGPEGGLHHGAAAVGVPAVVIFGGFIPPSVTGYDMHSNLAGSSEFCGSLKPCEHCRRAMENITVDQVYEEAMDRL